MLFERMDELEQLIRSSQSNHTVKLIQSYKSSVSFLPGERPFPYKGTGVPPAGNASSRYRKRQFPKYEIVGNYKLPYINLLWRCVENDY